MIIAYLITHVLYFAFLLELVILLKKWEGIH